MRGDGRVFLRGKMFWLSYCLNGIEQRESAETYDHAEAMKKLRHRMKEVGSAQLGHSTFVTPTMKRVTIAELVEALRVHLSLNNKLSTQTASHLKRVDIDFGTIRAAALTSAKADQYIQRRLESGDRPASVNRTTQLVGQAFKLAVKQGTVVSAPSITRLSEKGNARRGFLAPAEFSKVLSFLPEDLKDFAEWGYATGMRKGEASHLKWDMVVGDELRIPGDITKNRESRVLPLCGTIAEIIKRRRALRMVEVNGTSRMVDFVFHRDGVPVVEFRKSWATACKKAGVAGTRYHDLRRSCARNLTQAGVPRELAKKVTGHVSDSMWDRYNIVIVDDVRAALEKTEKYRETAQQKVVSIGG